MKIDLSKIDITDFNLTPCEFAGDECVWIYPKLEGTSWNQQNIILRSSIWRKSDGELVSPGFKKFFNWLQMPQIDPPPDALSGKVQVVEKLDGSCLIVSKYKGELIIRTRRALAETMLNGDEIAYFKAKYPRAFENNWLNNGWTLIYEWLTPSNQIVLRYQEPEIRLTGAIAHDTYTYMGQEQLDRLAEWLGVARPKYFKYDSLEEMIQKITDLKGEEGVCVYFGNGQRIRKIKSDWYNSVHCFRNAMNLKNIVDLYFNMDVQNYQDFCNKVEEQYTWEGLQMARPLISSVSDAMKDVHNILGGMERFLEKLKGKARKEQAIEITKAYGDTGRADILFTLLDKKPMNRNQWKKLVFQCLLDK